MINISSSNKSIRIASNEKFYRMFEQYVTLQITAKVAYVLGHDLNHFVFWRHVHLPYLTDSIESQL